VQKRTLTHGVPTESQKYSGKRQKANPANCQNSIALTRTPNYGVASRLTGIILIIGKGE